MSEKSESSNSNAIRFLKGVGHYLAVELSSYEVGLDQVESESLAPALLQDSPLRLENGNKEIHITGPLTKL